MVRKTLTLTLRKHKFELKKSMQSGRKIKVALKALARNVSGESESLLPSYGCKLLAVKNASEIFHEHIIQFHNNFM